MGYLKYNLAKAKNMFYKIDNNIYMKVYSFSTENINGYLKYFDLKNKSLLTVGSSGDQILNAYKEGCRDITLIDINPFAQYYIYLKISGILSLDYNEFQEFFYSKINNYNPNRFNRDLYKKISMLLKTIDYDSYYFFNELFNTYDCQQIINYLFNDDQDNYKVINKINNYLNDEESYNKLKNILKDISFKFINENIFDFKTEDKYDNIFLSNLCSTTGILVLKDLLVMLNNNLKENGSMQIAYLWNTNYFDNEFDIKLKEIYRMPATRTFLKDFITEHHNIEGINDILFEQPKKSDLVLIYRK